MVESGSEDRARRACMDGAWIMEELGDCRQSDVEELLRLTVNLED